MLTAAGVIPAVRRRAAAAAVVGLMQSVRRTLFQGLRGAWRHRLEDGLRRSRSPPTASSKGGQGVLERARSGLDDVLVSSPAAVGASALSSRELSQVPPHAFTCLLLAPLVLPIGTDAIPVLKPAPSRPQTLLTADPCAILTGLIR